MSEAIYGLAFLVLFSLSALGGVALRGRLHEQHLSSENMDAVRLVTGLLVTFAALILSLQLSTVRADFNAASRDRAIYAARLANLDQCLRRLGPEIAPTRLRLRQYTAAVIASTWPAEPPPFVEGMPDVKQMALLGEDSHLTEMIQEIGTAIDTLAPADTGASNTVARCRADYQAVKEGRWAVIEDIHTPSGDLFVFLISLWLALVFLSFGLQTPRRRLTTIVLLIGVLSISSVMFVIVDLGRPYGGFFGIPSTAMRDALTDMSP